MASSRDTSLVAHLFGHLCLLTLLDLCIKHFMLKLRNKQTAAPSAIINIFQNIVDIKDLYQAINNFIKCPFNRELFSSEHHRVGVEEALKGSLVLLDAIASTMDIISLMNKSILELESSLRRKSSAEQKHIHAYIEEDPENGQHIPKKLTQCDSGLRTNDKDLIPSVRMLRVAQTISFSTLISVVAYLTLAKAKGTSFLILTRLMHSKCIAEKQGENSEIEKVDQAF
ncbi:LOW QUALITY PROTEIN: hypothetical protein Cgig2_011166 [Carnegiea gigantea]|uniref:Uncharacterized protein n=1 Tax=Carnegiea gigantea TaxID=171969 RepID=A0A9Q1JH35_9CARY|nr:LOW QUALITY PROTEIN: hypothetical protein Cgig2_011166 [Carnegiea gigantea]